MRERESRALHATIDVLERRDDLTPLERDDLHSTRVWLSAGSNAPYLMVVRVNGHAFMFAAYTMIEAIWQRVFSEPLPVTRAWRGAFQSHRHRR